VVEDITKYPENYSIGTSRENVIKALDGFNNAIMLYWESPTGELHPMYKVGGTALGGEEMLDLVDAPYLDPPPPWMKKYTLVLDLDETLVHYFESNNQGKCLIRPGVS